MRGTLIAFGLLLAVHGCGDSSSDSSFSPTGGRAGSSGSPSGGNNAGGADASDGGDTSATGGTPGAAGDPGTAGDVGTGGSGTAGDGGAGMAGAGGAPPAPACPGTAPGCVIDWAGQLGTALSASQDGVGQAAVFGGNDNPRGLTGDGTYIYTAGNNCVRRVEIASATVETIAGQCGTPEYNDAQGTAARFAFIDGIATDGTTLWVADGGNAVIRAVNLSDNDVTTLTGQQGSPGTVDGDDTQAQFENLLGMTYDGTSLYVTQGGPSHAVRRIDPATGDVDTVAGNNGMGSTNGTGDIAEFSGPRKLGTDGTDLFIADTENHQVRRIVLGNGAADSHTVSTFVGSVSGYMDATGVAARFQRLRGITFDGTDLIVADSDNCVIRKVELPGGAVTTIAGIEIATCANHVEGIGVQAEFNKPMDIHYDPGTGDLFISESTLIRRMYYK